MYYEKYIHSIIKLVDVSITCTAKQCSSTTVTWPLKAIEVICNPAAMLLFFIHDLWIVYVLQQTKLEKV